MHSVGGYFDSAERDRIRWIMRGYMHANRIGTPKLRDLIAEANDLAARRDGKEPIALSTVQRFVAGRHRANDTFVGLCARFVAGLPDTDPVQMFGGHLAAFLAAGRTLAPVPQELVGMFLGQTRRPEITARGMRLLRPQGESDSLVPYSRVQVSALVGQPFCLMQETVEHRIDRTPLDLAMNTAPRQSYEGILTNADGTAFALLRNTLTGAPKTYWLTRNERGEIIGEGHEGRPSLDGCFNDTGTTETVIVVLSPPPLEDDHG